MDVTNPGLVNVADQVVGNPDPNSEDAQLVPEQLDILNDAADQGFPPASNGVTASVFPTPGEINIEEAVPLLPSLATFPPEAEEINVDNQVLGQGNWQDYDPGNPALGKRFVAPAEFTVVGSAQSVQTNNSVQTTAGYTVTGVYDADNLWDAPTADTTRFLLTLSNPPLGSYKISLLGREIVFGPNTTTAANRGAVRIIENYTNTYITISKSDPEDPTVPELATPVIGDVLEVDVQREGSQDVVDQGPPPINVFLTPSPPPFEPNPSQALGFMGTVDISTGPQPAPIITSGDQVPSAITVQVADQSLVVGLPANVNY